MNRNDANVAGTEQKSAVKPSKPRAPRSVRFADSEWMDIEKEAKARRMAPAEFVRHAAVSLATGELSPTSEPFPADVAGQIERIFRGVYLLATLRRDEMIRGGQQEELEKIAIAAREAQAAIRDQAVPTVDK
ncbi:MAG: hypothetical protein F4114_05410 [Rhodospirillaceae bacterium]|nr:hypothetical protein [Rhodospirillaceae bacterium]MYI48510.1 hypothetical protein [Rhodospirillaceae bacterium]